MAYVKNWYIKLDLKKQQDLSVMNLIENDSNRFNIQLFEDGTACNLTDINVIDITIKRPDENLVIGSGQIADIENGKIIYDVDLAALSVEGICEVSVELYSGVVKVSSTIFTFNAVSELNKDGQDVTGTNEYPILTQLLSDISTKETTWDAAEATRAANETTRESTFNTKITTIDEKITAADTATAGANTAKDSANTAAGLANTAATNANDKATLADTATINANNAATAANTAKDAADVATTAANTATTNANTAKDQAEAATTAASNAAIEAGDKALLADTAATNANNAKDNIVSILTGINEDEETRKANEILREAAEVTRETTFTTNETNRENTFNTKVTEVNNAVTAANGALAIAQSQPIQVDVIYDLETKLLKKITHTYEGYEEIFDITKRHNGLAETIIETKKIGNTIHTYQHDLFYTLFVDGGVAETVLSKMETTEI